MRSRRRTRLRIKGARSEKDNTCSLAKPPLLLGFVPVMVVDHIPSLKLTHMRDRPAVHLLFYSYYLPIRQL